MQPIYGGKNRVIRSTLLNFPRTGRKLVQLNEKNAELATLLLLLLLASGTDAVPHPLLIHQDCPVGATHAPNTNKVHAVAGLAGPGRFKRPFIPGSVPDYIPPAAASCKFSPLGGDRPTL